MSSLFMNGRASNQHPTTISSVKNVGIPNTSYLLLNANSQTPKSKSQKPS